MQGWSCEEMQNFEKIQTAYVINGYTIKGIQILVYSTLLILIIFHCVKKKTNIVKLPTFITILGLMNGIIAIIRFHSIIITVVDNSRDSFNMTFKISFFAESISFFGTIWLFSSSFYDTVKDLQNVFVTSSVSSSLDSSRSQRQTLVERKRFSKLIRWILFTVICLLCII